MSEKYDLIVGGTSFASMFFLHDVLTRVDRDFRVLALERGAHRSHRWQLKNPGELESVQGETYVNRHLEKWWRFSMGVGGSSNCWWACTPRMLPEDFELKSRYGVGKDWPISYDDLEPYYCRAEEVMGVAGPSDDTPFERSRPYPLPPHRLTDPDRVLKRAFPNRFFIQPSARFSRPYHGQSLCCGNGVCHLCPANAKFTILNGLMGPLEDPRVELRTRSRITEVDRKGGHVTGVVYEDTASGEMQSVQADMIALGTNALFNASILLRSGFDHPLLGRNIGEQVSVDVYIDLDGLDNFQGSTSITGHGYMHYAGEHRRDRAACLVETWNVPMLRNEHGKWRQRLKLKFIFEDLLDDKNRVVVDTNDLKRPHVEFHGHSTYTQRSLDKLEYLVESVVEPLPVEQIRYSTVNNTVAHILGTTVMGDEPSSSVLDPSLRMHGHDNLFILGSGAFPTAAPANPTLTLAALSLRAATKLFT